jgi:Mn-containing catalase
MRVYEMTADPTARAMIGYLLVRGGVHIVAYAKALEKLTGADVGRLLPIPDVSNKKFPEAMKHEANGLHTIMWKFIPRITINWIKSGMARTRRTARNWLSAMRCRPDFPGPKTPKSRNSVRPARSIQT